MRNKLMATLLVGAALLWGSGLSSASAAVTVLSSAQKAQLRYIVEEEKLARDVYNVLATTVANPRFANIARAEQIHMNEAAAVLKSYGLWNPTLNRAPGVFYNKTLANLYTSLVAKGKVSVADAYAVGVSIEQRDIADLNKMITSAAPADVNFMLASLKAGSTNHLAAFSRY